MVVWYQGANIVSIYALHNKTTNQATNYVGLTRQTKSLSLYVSHDETSSMPHLINQMERQQEKGTSLVFDALKDIEKKQAEKAFFTPVKEAAETLLTKVKDKFHRNEAFYQFAKDKGLPQEEAVVSVFKESERVLTQSSTEKDSSFSQVKEGEQDVFKQIVKSCEGYLYAHIAQKNITLTKKLRERIPLQAEKAANFIFYAHKIKNTEPTEKEAQLYLLRAKYEFDRIPQIKEKITEAWYEKGIFNKQRDPLFIHMMAERLASIEGRLYLEAKRMGQKPSSSIPKLAEAEFKIHISETKTLAHQLSSQYSLSETAAKEYVRNILRYQETHGSKPTNSQMTAMAEIAHQLEEKYANLDAREMDSHNLTYMRRMNGDEMLRDRCLQDKATIAMEYTAIQTQVKASLQHTISQMAKEVERENQKEMSL